MKHLAQIDFNALAPQASTRFGAGAEFTDLFTGNNGLINIMLFGGGALLLVYLLLGGLQLMLSGGDPKKVSSAQQTITNALLGIAIVIFAFFIVRAFGVIFGLQGVTQTFS